MRQAAEGVGGAGVDVLDLGIVLEVLAEDDANQVVGAGLVVAILHGRGDLVVGLGDDVFHVDAGGVVAKGAEGVDTGHAVLVSPKIDMELIVRGVGRRWRE